MTATAEFVVMGDTELENRLGESRRELLNLRFQLATGQLDNSARLGQVRRDVARILTILREREIAEAEAEADAGAATFEGAKPIPAAGRQGRSWVRRARSGEAAAVQAGEAPPEPTDEEPTAAAAEATVAEPDAAVDQPADEPEDEIGDEVDDEVADVTDDDVTDDDVTDDDAEDEEAEEEA
jgi:large subunit ribosomal protein L29